MSAQHASRPPAGAFVRRAGEQRAVDAPAGRLTFAARSAETGGALTLGETLAPPGAGPPHHVHTNDDELIYVLDGKLCVRLMDEVHEAPAGTFVFIPKGIPHTWQVLGAADARFLFAFTPAAPGMERFFERSDELASDARVDAFPRFAADAGMELVGPPLARSHPRDPSGKRSRCHPDS